MLRGISIRQKANAYIYFKLLIETHNFEKKKQNLKQVFQGYQMSFSVRFYKFMFLIMLDL